MKDVVVVVSPPTSNAAELTCIGRSFTLDYLQDTRIFPRAHWLEKKREKRKRKGYDSAYGERKKKKASIALCQPEERPFGIDTL